MKNFGIFDGLPFCFQSSNFNEYPTFFLQSPYILIPHHPQAVLIISLHPYNQNSFEYTEEREWMKGRGDYLHIWQFAPSPTSHKTNPDAVQQAHDTHTKTHNPL